MREKAGPIGVPPIFLLVMAAVFVTVIPFFCVIPSSTQAAVTTSITPTTGTGNLDTTITQAGNSYNITGGTRPDGGPNLFHSFGTFSVGAGDIANFLNTPVNESLPFTSNILGRVTEGNISNIFGTIQTTGFGNANLFLMNPAGFLFGPNATLNVGGMVSFTTADYLRLPAGTTNGYFYADPAGPSLLTSAPVTAFGFLGPNAASIAIQGGTLEVPDGKTLSFIGGPGPFTTDTGVTVPAGVSMTGGSLSAPNGLIYMATVTSPGEIPVPTLSGPPLGSLGLPSSDPAVIRIRSGEFVMDHAFLTATNTSTTAQPAIAINVQGTMTLRNASSISTETFGAGHGSDVHIAAQSIQMDGSSIKSTSPGDGRGGDISINGQTIVLTGGSQIVSGSQGAGAGGNISLEATSAISLSGSDPTNHLSGVFTDLPAITSGVYTTTSAGGQGGSILITAPTVTLEDSAQLAALTAIGGGNGGNVSLDVGTLNLRSGGLITTLSGLNFSGSGAISGTGQAGNIIVTASDSIFIGGVGAWQNNSIIRSMSFGSGSGGSVTVMAPFASVTLDDRGVIETTTVSNERAGDITLNVKNLTITDGGGIQTRGNDFASSGNIQITAHDTISLMGQFDTDTPSRILNENGGFGGTGSISIQTANLGLTGGARILSDTTFGSEGADVPKIVIAASDSITISNGSRIDVRNFLSDVGALVISARNLTLANGATISTQTFDIGTGGPIKINLDNNLTLSGGSQITSASLAGVGNGGDVDITAKGTISLSGQATDQFGQITPTGILSSTSAGFPDPSFTGNAGHIVLSTNALEVLAGARIESSSNAFALGNAGQITLTIPTVTVNGGAISTSTQYNGNAGAITLNANTVTLSNGGQLNSSSVIRAPFFEGEEIPIPTGTAGNITIQGLQGEGSRANWAGIEGAGSGLFTETHGIGAGGNILIETNQSTTLTNGAAVSASSTGTMDDAGDAGMVTIHAGDTLVMQNSSVTTQATKSGGGQIQINAANLFRLINSKVSSSVLDGTGGGGDIFIDPNVVVLQNGQVVAQAVQGAGGNITITTPLFLSDQSSLVSASSLFGLNGTVTIQSPASNVSGSVGTLPSDPSQAQSLLTQRCAALANGQASSFVVAGREQLPADPGSWLTSPLYATGVGEGQGVRGKGLEGLSTNEGREVDTQILSLRRLTPSGFLIANFADSEATGCHS